MKEYRNLLMGHRNNTISQSNLLQKIICKNKLRRDCFKFLGVIVINIINKANTSSSLVAVEKCTESRI